MTNAVQVMITLASGKSLAAYMDGSQTIANVRAYIDKNSDVTGKVSQCFLVVIVLNKAILLMLLMLYKCNS